MKDETKEQNQNIQPRPPIVVVLGHVDHGKSSILEAIKDLKITEKEAGGITQHVGAYEVEHQDKKITFIDTPGHEAFSAIRSRGAKVADIAVLVIAADDGVKPQTKEAITHIKKAGISFIVALNKIDKPTADPEKVKRELVQQDVLVETMAGKIPSVGTSATTKKGINELLELILLTAEIEELKGDISKLGEGVIIEAYLDSKRGPTATLLLRDGKLKLGDIIATASCLGRVKVLENFQGETITQAFPSMPIIVIGFEDVPQIGEKFRVYPDIISAQKYLVKKERKKIREPSEVFSAEAGKRILNLVLKADVSGSLEAIEGMLKGLPQEKVIARVLESKVGEVNENDVKLAQSAKAKVLSFRVKVNPIAAKLAEREGIKIITFDVIYELIQAVRQLMEKTIKPAEIREELGKMKVLLIFRTEKNRQIVGGKIIEGKVKKGLLIEVIHNDEKVGKGKIVNLQKNKKDIEIAGKGEEAGILYEGNVKVEEGDTLLFYTERKEKLTYEKKDSPS